MADVADALHSLEPTAEYMIRGEKVLSDAGFDTWTLIRPSDDARRTLTIEEEVIPLLLEEEGFKRI